MCAVYVSGGGREVRRGNSVALCVIETIGVLCATLHDDDSWQIYVREQFNMLLHDSCQTYVIKTFRCAARLMVM